MSRVGEAPIQIPEGVEVFLIDGVVFVKGPLGSLDLVQDPSIEVLIEDGWVRCVSNGSSGASAMHGTTRALIANMILGVSRGFQKKLLLIGTGYRVQIVDSVLNLSLGYSHPVVYRLPEGVQAEAPVPTEIIVKGIDKQKIGLVASQIRLYRKPEPYKGKGVRYSDEIIVLKDVKKK